MEMRVNKQLRVNKNSNKNSSNWQQICQNKAPSENQGQFKQNPKHAVGIASHWEGHEHCLTFLLSNEGMATPLERLRSDTSTFRMFWI